MLNAPCSDIANIERVTRSRKHVCEDCVKVGSLWVHLRVCQECGGTRCCDESPNRHARRHAKASGHPVIASAEPGESWLYCFPDDVLMEY
ncbi:MAG: UBP-type zinc finger domain-containing protein [Vicinamibacteria bacterium]